MCVCMSVYIYLFIIPPVIYVFISFLMLVQGTLGFWRILVGKRWAKA